jgi:rare lipoprotein A (peptidoglycan hydrolase)
MAMTKKPLVAGLAFACSLVAVLGGSAVGVFDVVPSGRMPQNSVIVSLPPLPASKQVRARPKIMRGVASWYGGPIFHVTANGETFHDNRMAAASRTLPFNTRVRVTNLRNGRSVVVRINDRGPYVHGRMIDLTPEAAEKLHMKYRGLAPVAIEIVSNDSRPTAANSVANR